jgi:iodotyrosine deiodinase
VSAADPGERAARDESVPALVPLTGFVERDIAEMRSRADAYLGSMRRRRTVRQFSDRPVPRDIIETCIEVAGTAPSGANHQPWRFVAVSNASLKREIRRAAEEEERAFYGGRAPADWLEALAPLGTDAEKPFLERAPWLIVVFGESWGRMPDGSRRKNYYVTESVGIATGMLISALHLAGLATLTHTPSPMKFLNAILGRPDNERPFLVLVAGYPAADARVPVIEKKTLADIADFVE